MTQEYTSVSIHHHHDALGRARVGRARRSRASVAVDDETRPVAMFRAAMTSASVMAAGDALCQAVEHRSTAALSSSTDGDGGTIASWNWSVRTLLPP